MINKSLLMKMFEENHKIIHLFVHNLKDNTLEIISVFDLHNGFEKKKEYINKAYHSDLTLKNCNHIKIIKAIGDDTFIDLHQSLVK